MKTPESTTIDDTSLVDSSMNGNGNHQQADILEWFTSRRLGHSILPKEDLYRLIKLAQKGNIKARNEIIEHNLKLVFSIAQPIYNRGSSFVKKNLDLMDLIQVGSTGLIRAIERFDVKGNYAFSTYATWWIKQRIRKLMKEERDTVRVPTGLQYLRSKLYKITVELEQKLDREPTENEIKEEAKKRNIPVPKNALGFAHAGTVSISDPVGSDFDTDGTLEDILAEPCENTARQEVGAEVFRVMEHMLNELKINERKKEMFCRCFGMNGYEPQVLEDVAEYFGVSHQAIQHMRDRIIWLIYRKPSRQRILESLKKDLQK